MPNMNEPVGLNIFKSMSDPVLDSTVAMDRQKIQPMQDELETMEIEQGILGPLNFLDGIIHPELLARWRKNMPSDEELFEVQNSLDSLKQRVEQGVDEQGLRSR